MLPRITIYDTTLRDGAQTVGIAYSLQDKIRIARELDKLHIDFIEGGWPGANPKDSLFFEEIRKIELKHSKIAAFCSTRRHKLKIEDDKILQALVASKADVLTVFGKTWDFHVTTALGITLEENLELIYSTVAYLKDKGFTVFFDGEHFLDGYKTNPDYALQCFMAAEKGGADQLILCDTNGGTLPDEITDITRKIFSAVKTPLGIHCHNDGGLAVANSLAAVSGGAVSVQGTMNGYGERCGNADLCSIIPNLALKMNYPMACSEKLHLLTEASRFVSETANLAHNDKAPFVGSSAFAHKGGIHVSAINKDSRTYEHIEPEKVGNRRRVTISDQSGKSNIQFKAQEFGIDLSDDSKAVNTILSRVKSLEDKGFQFEGAEGSLELIMQEACGRYTPFFILKGFRIISEKKENSDETVCEASIKVEVNGKTAHTAANGTGPVGALDAALRKALEQFYPDIREVHLTDYKVRVLDEKAGTNAPVRVLMSQKRRDEDWGTVGVSENIIEASWQAMVDGIEYMLFRTLQKKDKTDLLK
ncbi:MAG: citramalate synthase [Spirochaetota bacterium]